MSETNNDCPVTGCNGERVKESPENTPATTKVHYCTGECGFYHGLGTYTPGRSPTKDYPESKEEYEAAL